jgi:hypothetical protein
MVARCGMPPNFSKRFATSYEMYQRTLQPQQWQTFLEQVRKERADANIVVRFPIFFQPLLTRMIDRSAFGE